MKLKVSSIFNQWKYSLCFISLVDFCLFYFLPQIDTSLRYRSRICSNISGNEKYQPIALGKYANAPNHVYSSI